MIARLNADVGVTCADGATPDGGKTLVKLGTAANPAATAASGAANVTTQFTQGPPYDAVVYLRSHVSVVLQAESNL